MKNQSFKIVLVGDPKVGKSNLLLRFAYNKFSDVHKITIGVEFASKAVTVQDEEFKLGIWDTCGEEKFRALTKTFYQGAVGALIVFDVTDRKSFESIPHWLKDIETNSSQIVLMLVGNKVDIQEQREVTSQEGMKFAFDNNMAYIETSALSGLKVQEAFQQLTTEIVKLTRAQPEQEEKVPVRLSKQRISNQNANEKKKCC